MSFPPRPTDGDNDGPTNRGFVVNASGGDAYWWLGTLSVNLLDGAQSGGSVDVVDHTVPVGYAPPPHIHRDQDEIFYVLAGEFKVHCGPDEFVAEQGALVFLPKGVSHGFEMTSDEPGRTLLINVPSGFADVVAELGTPAMERSLPPADSSLPDPSEIERVSELHGIFAAEEH